MPGQPLRVMVVDDSLMMREMISDALRGTPGIEVCGTAADGQKAIDQLDTLRPDVITLDVQMPRMDGLATLDAILAKRPTPVIMVSALTQVGANITFDALERGAADFVAKPEGMAAARALFQEELPRKIRAVSGLDMRRLQKIRADRAARKTTVRPATTATPPRGPDASAAMYADKVIALGISTGGPPALTSLFEGLAPSLPPIVVVQHMPAQFTGAFAQRLNSVTSLTVKEAASGDCLQPNHIYIAPGGAHTKLVRKGRRVELEVFDAPAVSGHKPSVDVMMTSAAELYGKDVLGIIMTGMGRDGADGCGRIRAKGGYTLGQDEASSAVYGMNKIAFTEGHIDRQFNLEEAPQIVTAQVRKMWSRGPALASV